MKNRAKLAAAAAAGLQLDTASGGTGLLKQNLPNNLPNTKFKILLKTWIVNK